MKKLLFTILTFLILLSFSQSAFARKLVEIMDTSGDTSGVSYVCAGGASVYIIDTLADPEWELANVRSLQFSGVTQRWTVTPSVSGATISLFETTTNYFPAAFEEISYNIGTWLADSITENLEWRSLVVGMPHDTGNTAYQYTWKPKAGRYQILKLENSGITDIQTELKVGFHREFTAPYIDTTSNMYEFDLATDGFMGAINGVSTFQIDGSDNPLDITLIKPNLAIWSIQVYSISPGPLTASSNEGGTSPWQSSGVTYTIDYSTSNYNGIWSSGTTTIMGPIALSGQSTEVIPFTPEPAKYYRFRVTAGITQFALKARLIIQ